MKYKIKKIDKSKKMSVRMNNALKSSILDKISTINNPKEVQFKIFVTWRECQNGI